jgi:signal transduction histidine kinase
VSLPRKLPIDKLDFERVLNFLPFPFLVSETKADVTYSMFVNKSFLQEIGYQASEIGTIDKWFQKAYPNPVYRREVVEEWKKRLSDASQAGEDFVTMKAKVLTKEKGEVWYEVKASLYDDVHLVAFINIHDIVVNEEKLDTMHQAKDRTLSILSHDLRIPITNLLAISNIALNGQMNQDEFMTHLQAINKKIFQVMELIDTTLIWTRSNFKQIHVKIEEVDLPKIVRSIMDIYESTFLAKNIWVDVRGLDDSSFQSDREIITILIRNIFSNAIKFTPERGEIIIELVREANTHKLSITDNGIGMDPETIDGVHSGKYTTRLGTRHEKGLGVGLTLCLELAKKINASLLFKSKPGKGTSVTINLEG